MKSKKTSPTREKWEGRWEQLKGKAKSLRGELTNDELQQAQGDYQRLLGIVKEKTGKTRQQIERLLNA
jgi:uncharacterized protein YjbJ (UPF0337 family)